MAAPKDFTLSPELHRYVLDHSTTVDDVLNDLITRTAALGPISGMQIAPEQGLFMTSLTAALAARRVVEVGTFTGYSTLCIARGLPEGGRILACDVSEEWTAIARDAWARAAVDDRIDLVIAPAIETLRALPPAGEEPIDLAFIDADKPSYLDYYEALVPRLRRDGVLLVDNVLWSGNVIDPSVDDENTRAIRAFNTHVAGDDRVEVVILPIADGLSFVRKR